MRRRRLTKLKSELKEETALRACAEEKENTMDACSNTWGSKRRKQHRDAYIIRLKRARKRAKRKSREIYFGFNFARRYCFFSPFTSFAAPRIPLPQSFFSPFLLLLFSAVDLARGLHGNVPRRSKPIKSIFATFLAIFHFGLFYDSAAVVRAI